VTALDQYGNSEQLQHAREAGLQHGTLVVAARAQEVVVVLSVHPRPQKGILLSSVPNNMVHRLTLPHGNDPMVGLVCSGVKADAMWLIRALRSFQTQKWERYNVILSPEKIQEAMAQVLLSFMGYSRPSEFLDSVGTVMGHENDENEVSWSRPLGVTSMILSSGSPILLVEPSGACQSYVAYAIGKYSEEVNELLEKRYNASVSIEETQELLVNVTREVLRESSEYDESTNLLVEIVSIDGTERKTIPFMLTSSNRG